MSNETIPITSSSSLTLENNEMTFHLLTKQYELAKMNYVNDLKNSPTDETLLYNDKQILNDYNSRMITLVEQMQTDLTLPKDIPSHIIHEKHEKLNQMEHLLWKERNEIRTMLSEYNLLNEAYQETLLMVQSNYLWLSLWIIVMILCFFFLMKNIFFYHIDLHDIFG